MPARRFRLNTSGFHYYKRVDIRKLTIVIVAVICLIMLAVSQFNPRFGHWIRNQVIDFFSPVLEIVMLPVRSFISVRHETENLVSLRIENQRLQIENEELRQLSQNIKALSNENETLKKLIHFIPEDASHFVTARVVGVADRLYEKSFIVNAGLEHGVQKDDVVVSQAGLVGRIIAVGDRAARVLLMTDVASRIPVVLEGSRDRAVLKGNNAEAPYLLYLAPKSQKKLGQVVLTSGHGGMFPPGLSVGKIATIDKGRVTVKSAIDWEKLDFVKIVNYGIKERLRINGN